MSKIINEVLPASGIFDTHAHYFDKRFAAETEGSDTILVRDVFGEGIDGVINVGTNNENNIVCIEQAKKYEKMYAAVGIHPEDAAYCKFSIDEELARLCELLCTSERIKENKIVAIGEIGLDYHYDGFDKVLQQEYFDRQLNIAERYGLPVVIHDRDAHGDCFETVLRHPNVRGVFHSFSGSREMALELVKRGWYISFSGVLTFKNARKCVEVAEAVPMNRILIETDCPYLAPHPYRGRINHSGLMYLTAQKLAEIKGITYAEAVKKTRENTITLFGV
jgi:TatD DNase family protein